MHAATKRALTASTAGAIMLTWAVATQGATLAQDADAPAVTAVAADGPDELADQLLTIEDEFTRDVLDAGGYADIDAVVAANADEKLILQQLANVTRLEGTYRGVEDELRALYERAERAGGPVGDAVGDAARAWIVLGHGIGLADDALNNDLVLPREAFDDDGVSVGADYAGGLVDAALRTILEANERLQVAHLALSEAPLDPVLQAAFVKKSVDWRDYRAEEEPIYAALLSEPTTQILINVDRFVSSAAGTEARARSASYACADREAYAVVSGDVTEEVAVVDLDAARALDCPAPGDDD